jgi:hypothetical protein
MRKGGWVWKPLEDAPMQPEISFLPRPRVETVGEETLVPDLRARLTPAQMVERKLVSLLKSAPLPVSQLQTGRQRLPR